MVAKIYLARHATPDSKRNDLQYDILPGPPLDERGVAEALLMGEFLRTNGVVKIYTSPFDRAQRTARLAAGVAGVPVVTQNELSEWRRDETASDIHARLDAWFDLFCRDGERGDPVCLVSHGGILAIMLTNLGMPKDVVKSYCLKYGGTQPVPPAGVWRAIRSKPYKKWLLDIVFLPPALSP